MIKFNIWNTQATEEHLGLIPMFFVEADPRPAVEQIDERYAHGGGWFDLRVGPQHFTQEDDFARLMYPEDRPLLGYAEATLHAGTAKAERIVIFESGFVAVVQQDGSFRVARLD